MDLSVIVVDYNTKELTRRCLRSVFASRTKYSFEVIVSDNGSSDGSLAMLEAEFPKVTVIKNGRNLGFSKANNVAIAKASGVNILLLNSDTEVTTETFDLCLAYMQQHPEAGILGCKVLLPDGTLDPACRRRFPNPYNAFLRLFGLKKFSDYNITGAIEIEQEVDAVMGAYLLIRRSVVDKIGLLDEDFFMYGEDLDWCFRAKAAGYKVVYYPKARITHYKYGSSQTAAAPAIRFAHEAMKIFYRKHYASKYPWIFNQLIYLGIAARQYWVMAVNLFRRKKRVH